MCGKRGWFLWPIFLRRRIGHQRFAMLVENQVSTKCINIHSGILGKNFAGLIFLPNAMEIMTRLMGFTSVGGNESQFIFLANALWFL